MSATKQWLLDKRPGDRVMGEGPVFRIDPIRGQAGDQRSRRGVALRPDVVAGEGDDGEGGRGWSLVPSLIFDNIPRGTLTPNTRSL